MNNLALFDFGVADEDDTFQGLINLQRYVQDNLLGFPAVSSEAPVDSVYKDTQPQQIEAIEIINIGMPLNVFYDGDAFRVRKASAIDPEKFCNSFSLSAANAPGDLISCAVKIAVRKASGLFAGPVFLGETPGTMSNQIPFSNAAIVQKIGDVDTAGNFFFSYGSPFLL